MLFTAQRSELNGKFSKYANFLNDSGQGKQVLQGNQKLVKAVQIFECNSYKDISFLHQLVEWFSHNFSKRQVLYGLQQQWSRQGQDIFCKRKMVEVSQWLGSSQGSIYPIPRL